jgi:hypothetical protein
MSSWGTILCSYISLLYHMEKCIHLWPNELKDASEDNSDSDSWEDHDELKDALEADSDCDTWEDQAYETGSSSSETH